MSQNPLLILGILQRLDYFQYLGVEAIWLSPIYTSPMVDFGYDVANFTEVDPIFGTLLDFEELVEEAHAKGENTSLQGYDWKVAGNQNIKRVRDLQQRTISKQLEQNIFNKRIAKKSR